MLTINAQLEALRSTLDTLEANAKSPSGLACPTRDDERPGFNLILAEDFDSKPASLAIYDYTSPPRSTPEAWWDEEHFDIGQQTRSVATLRAFRNEPKVSAGYAPNRIVTAGGGFFKEDPAQGYNGAEGFTYGSVQYRVRSLPDPVVNGVQTKEIKHVGLCYAIDKRDSKGQKLYPWPTFEADVFEDAGGDRQSSTFTLHCLDSSKRYRKIQKRVEVDRTEWHTFGFDWYPLNPVVIDGIAYGATLVLTLDGEEYGRVEGPFIPAVPIVPIIQSEAARLASEDRTLDAGDRAALEIDWIAAWKLAE